MFSMLERQLLGIHMLWLTLTLALVEGKVAIQTECQLSHPCEHFQQSHEAISSKDKHADNTDQTVISLMLCETNGKQSTA